MVWLEALSYIVTILGFPLAIAVFAYEQRRRRQNEEYELNRMLSQEYDNFLRLALDHADLLLLRKPGIQTDLSDEQKERKHILLTILVSLFEKAYIVVYNEHMTRDTARLWMSWEDSMREWCRREDFRAALPRLLEGEDDEFSEHIRAIAREEERRADAATV
jgi:hypothetical protein